jgi:predicted TIM-barrel fold metal-dependent hydrolase
MKPFVFSCDAHIAEPPTLFLDKLPAHLQKWALHQEAGDGYRIIKMGDIEALKVKTDFHSHKTGQGDDGPKEDRSCVDEKETFISDCAVDTKRRGARDMALRLADMDRDGIDAELVFPSLGLILPRIPDREAQVESCKVYNDWALEYCAASGGRLVAAAMIPCIDLDDALAECKRTEAMGYAAFCLWEGMDNYNEPAWDPIFAFAAEKGIPLVFHVGVGTTSIRAKKGPGSGVFNYTRQMNDAIDIITLLVAGGVLDRNPNAHILFAEHSAGWLWGLAERMDEIYEGHAPVVYPKLKRMPSQIVRDQVHCALQNDVGSVATRRGVGIGALLFATDYPHSEGTFPFSMKVVDKMMAVNADASMDDFVAVLGGNAAKLFGRANLADKVAQRAAQLTAA